MACNSDSEQIKPSYTAMEHVSFEQAAAKETAASHQDEKTTSLQTYIHLTKGYIGPGCLSLPWAFSQLGIVGGVLSCIAISYWTSINCYKIVQLKKAWSTHDHHLHTFPEIGEFAYGKRFRSLVTACICIQQLAVCTVFLSFVGENILAVVPADALNNHAVVITLALPAVLGLSCLGNLRKLAPVTLAGTFCLSFALALLFVVLAEHYRARDEPVELPTLSLSQAPLAMCAILYSYEGICLILPVEGAMQHRADFPKVFWSAMATACTVFCLVASFSVAVFGQVENGSITAFLLKSPELYHREMILIANTMVSISIILTYPLQLYPCLELVGEWIYNWRNGNEYTLPNNDDEEEDDLDAVSQESDEDDDFYAIPGDSPWLRLGLVLFTYVIAIAIPNVQQLISLSGALAGSSVALIIPPLLELEAVKRSHGSISSIIKCYASCLVGTVFMLIGTGASIADIVRLYLSSGNDNAQ